jgi:hypothetical protein
LEELAFPFTLVFGSPYHVTTSRKMRDIDTDISTNLRGSFHPHAYIDAIGIPTGCQTNLKPEIKLKQDSNQYVFGGPLYIKISIG